MESLGLHGDRTSRDVFSTQRRRDRRDKRRENRVVMTDAYIELHARSAFSFLEGACVPEDLAGACASLDMPAMALLDRNGVYGSPRFHMAAKKAGVRAHIGSEITCDNGRTYPLLAASREGYRNLCRLVTRMKLRAPKGEGSITLDELAEFSRGLICLTAHPDERLLDIFGRHALCAELQRHHNREEEAHNQAVIERARRLGIRIVATNNPAYAVPAQRELLDVFTCIPNKVTLATAGRLLEGNSGRSTSSRDGLRRHAGTVPLDGTARHGDDAHRAEGSAPIAALARPGAVRSPTCG